VLNLIQLETADIDIGVLIVGAGPTGIMLANQPERRGVRVSRSATSAGA
jgi:ribulose 1,5-bisphosphate synthetase/thiazole synthase